MEDHSKDLLQRSIQKGRAKCLSDALGVDVTPETHPELLTSIDKTLEAYPSLEYDGIFGVFGGVSISDNMLQEIDDCITSLQKATPWLELLENLQLSSEGKLVRTLKEEERRKIETKYRNRLQRINSLLRDLQRLRGVGRRFKLHFLPRTQNNIS